MEIKNTKDFARYSAALRAFMNCRYFLSLLNEEKNDEIRSALWGAACVNYRRPFGNNGEFGTISTKLIPAEFKQLHESLKDQRDGFFAHTDGSIQKEGVRVHETYFVVQDGRVEVQDQFVLPNPDSPETLNDLTLKLIEEISTAQRTYLDDAFSTQKLSDGEYALNWESNSLLKTR